jgi:hypothetical protein
MPNGVPIRVKIGLRPNGHADHPDWTTLPLAGNGSREEKEQAVSAHQIIKWRYDNTSGHQDDTADSPRGMQWGMMVVSQQFALEAVAKFPSLVTVMTDAQAQDFWDNRVYARTPPVKYDTDVLNGLALERQLRQARNLDLTEIDSRIDKALDPSNPAMGVRENREVKFANIKADLKLSIVS